MHECYEKNLELSKKMHENITGTKQLEADVNNMPSDFDIENFSMAEYKESAEKFIARCTDLIERVKTYQRGMYSAKFTVEQLQAYLHELRTQIGDADLIVLTDQLFQRTHLRHLQAADQLLDVAGVCLIPDPTGATGACGSETTTPGHPAVCRGMWVQYAHGSKPSQ